MKRLDDTGHSPRLFAEFDAAGLVAPIQLKWVSIEKGLNHPVLPFRNAVQCLSERGKLPALLGDCFFLRAGFTQGFLGYVIWPSTKSSSIQFGTKSAEEHRSTHGTC